MFTLQDMCIWIALLWTFPPSAETRSWTPFERLGTPTELTNQRLCCEAETILSQVLHVFLFEFNQLVAFERTVASWECWSWQGSAFSHSLVRPQRSSRNWSTQLRWHRLKTCVPCCVVWICLVLRVLAFGACRQNFWAWRVPSMCRARCFNTLIESSKSLSGWNSFRI